jgi:hypothetical protein
LKQGLADRFRLQSLEDAGSFGPKFVPKPIRSFLDAEDVAAEWMRCHGFPDATTTPVGRDEGVDVPSENAIARVKAQVVPVGRTAASKQGSDWSLSDIGTALGFGFLAAVQQYSAEVAPQIEHAPALEGQSLSMWGLDVVRMRAHEIADIERQWAEPLPSVTSAETRQKHGYRNSANEKAPATSPL